MSVRPHRQQPTMLPVPGILQAGTLEWGAISFSNAGKWKVKVKTLSRIRLFATPWTAAHQAPPSMGPSRQEYWSGVPLPSPIQQQESAISIHVPFLFCFPPPPPVCLLNGKDMYHLSVKYIKSFSHLINMQWDNVANNGFWQNTKMKSRFGHILIISDLLDGLPCLW